MIRTQVLWSVIASSCLFCLNAYGKKGNLSPEYHPRNSSYYVCYLRRIPIFQDKWSRYYTLNYQGCSINLTPCEALKVRPYLRFGWYKTYPHALNAFYQCTYS